MSTEEEPEAKIITAQKDAPTKYHSFLAYDRDDPRLISFARICIIALFIITLLSLDLGGVSSVACVDYDKLASGLCASHMQVIQIKNIAFSVSAILLAIAFIPLYFHKKISRYITAPFLFFVAIITVIALVLINLEINHVDSEYIGMFLLPLIQAVVIAILSVITALIGGAYILVSKKARKILDK